MSNSYVLVTPARNEEAYVERTIESVICQTIVPKKWVIVSDGSTDRTNKIVGRYAEEYDFVQLLALNEGNTRSFGAKVRAFETGREQLDDLKYEYIGNLDADLSFSEYYYQNLLEKFNERPRLGIAGGVRFAYQNDKWVQEFSGPWSVCAGVQLFRRECYKDIGGYIPVERMEDCVAEVVARMRGWEVHAFPDMKIFHYRPMGSTMGSTLRELFRYGEAEYKVGYYPLYAVAKFLYRIREKPYFIGSLLRLCGYLSGALPGKQRVLSDDVVKFLRTEQRQRLVAFVKGEVI